MKRVLSAVIIALLAASALSAAPGDLLDAQLVESYTWQDIRAKAVPMFDVYGVPDLYFGVDHIRIRYESTDFDGSEATIGANLFVPRVPEGGSVPLLVFGSGTTGVSDHCAPSLEQPLVRRWGHYEANMMSYASNGIVTVFPDYLGFNDPNRPQRYFSKDAEAHVMLDAVRAARSYFQSRMTPVDLSEWVFVAGYSQGGHAAFSAADKQPDYAPDVQIDGVISYGGTMNVETLLREGPYYAPYIFYTYQRMYGSDAIDPTRYLQPQYADTLAADVERMCVDEFQRFYPFDGTQLYQPDFYAALMEQRLGEEYGGLKDALDANIAGLSGHGVPSLVIQGSRDVIITSEAQAAYVRQVCETGADVVYLDLPAVRHRFTRAAGFRPTLEWIDQIMAGETPSNCR